MPLSETPAFNLKAVLNETGLAADTLRAWERRYGVPAPQRTPGGHRLYSEHDIYLIKWLLARQAEGLSISRAVDRWNQLTEAGEDPLAGSAVARQAGTGSGASLDAFREEWLAHGLDFDEVRAEQTLNQAFALFSVETVVTEVLLRGLREVGERWRNETATVQQEHFVSALAVRRLDALIAAAPMPVGSGAIVLACPPSELHSLPLLFLSLMLRRRGRSVVFLGADVPTDHLEEMARGVRAVLVVLSAQRLTTAVQLRYAANLLTRQGIRVGFGGRVFNEVPPLRDMIAGEFLGPDIETAAARIDEILQRNIKTPRPSLPLVPDSIVEEYGRSRAAIEATLQKNAASRIASAEDLTIANSYFAGALSAALGLGNISYLAADMDWMEFLLARPNMPFASPRDYLLAYAAAARQVMGSQATEIADWLEHYAGTDTKKTGRSPKRRGAA